MANGLRNFRDGEIGRWIQFISGAVIIPAVTAALIWGIKIHTDVAIIKSNRFTAADGAEIWRALDLKADKTNVPPQWFRDDVRAIKLKIEEIDVRLSRIEGRLEER